MTTIFTLLRGDADLTRRWVGAVNSISQKTKVNAVVTLPEGCDVPEGLVDDVDLTIHKVAKCEMLHEGEGHELSCERTDVILALYNEFLNATTGDRVLILEDDITPPQNGLELLDSLIERKVK